MMDKSTIEMARQTNIVAFLLERGEKLIKEGKRFKHAEHDSLIFKDNVYFWNSKGEHGNAVDFLMSFYGMDFETAVKELTETIREKKENSAPPSVPSQPFSFSDIELCSDMRRTMAYLTITRKIDIKIIQELINNKYIYQENATNNIIFAMYDECKNVVGAELCGTLSDIRYKGIKEGSKYGYGFNVGFADEHGSFSYALFFESAVDLISFIEISRMKDKPLTGCLLVSLSGLKENIITNTLNAFKSPLRPLQCVLSVDNDISGQNLYKSLTGQNKAVKAHFPESQFKDWNEQLKFMKGGAK